MRRNENFDRLNESFPWASAPSIVLTVILLKVHSIYFHDKGLKFMLLQSEMCIKKGNIFDNK